MRNNSLPLFLLLLTSVFTIPFTVNASEENNTTILSLEPDVIEVPYLDGNDIGTIILVNLKISKVSNLKEFS